MFFIIFLVLLSVIVFIHELGHFLVARFYGIPVETFSIGFGKSLLDFTDKKGTKWQFAMIPLGGYVQISPDDLFGIKKIFVALAGPLMNFILSFFIFGAMIFHFGTAEVLPTIKEVLPNSLAQKHHIQPKDEILLANGQSVQGLRDIVKASKVITLKIKLQDKVITEVIEVTEPQLGIVFDYKVRSATIREAMMLSCLSIGTICKGIASHLFSLSGFKNMGGILSIFSVSQLSYQSGWQSFLSFAGFISVNLGFINLLPFPILDGGNVVFGFLEAIRKRRLSQKIYEKFLFLGAFILMIIMVIAFVNDIFRRI